MASGLSECRRMMHFEWFGHDWNLLIRAGNGVSCSSPALPISPKSALDSPLDALPPSASEFVTIAKVGEIPSGEGRCYSVNGRMIAVFFADGQYYAVDDVCPHMGASLAGGWIEEGVIICPWHAWRFCSHKGTWLDNPRSPLRVGTYELRIEGGEISVRVPVPPAS